MTNAKTKTVGRRHQLLDSKSSITPSVNAASSDERKVVLNFCVSTWCWYFEPDEGSTCYCCPAASQKEYCHPTEQECRANCATCTPKCPPPRRLLDHDAK